MSDPLRTENSRALDVALDSDRDSKIEQLLLVGLDHYFAGQHEQAINVWTRVLFLDRGHARARAYIERARSMLAERAREGEELLQRGLSASARGDAEEAKRLLEAAMANGAPPDDAFRALDRLHWHPDGADAGDSRQPPAHLGELDRLSHVAADPADSSEIVRPSSRLKYALIASALVLAAVVMFGVVRPPWLQEGLTSLRAWWLSVTQFERTASAPVLPLPEPELTLPPRGDLAFERARALAASGHVREALAALDIVRPTDARRADAEQLRAVLQRQLIDASAADVPSEKRANTGGQP